jgi:predicted transcriptional regulator
MYSPSATGNVFGAQSQTQMKGFSASDAERRMRRLPRDKIYIIKDVMMRLLRTGEMNKSMLLSLCGLNSKIHAFVLDDLEERNFVVRRRTRNGAKEISIYNITYDGMQFCNNILTPYEEVFPRKARGDVN